MRFLHTSDWHIGRILFERSLLTDQEYILERFVELVQRSDVDLVVIAGDIYDRAVPPKEAVRLLDDVLSRIVLQLKKPVFLISGNHDSAERLGFGSRMLSENRLRIVSSIEAMREPSVFEDRHGKVRFYGLPYFDPADVRVEAGAASAVDHDSAMRWCIESLLPSLDPREAAVAVAHGFLAGGEESPDSERPLAIGGTTLINAAQFKPFAYSALGHLHRPQNVGSPNVRYSGSLLPYSFEEARGEKSVSIVELGADRVPRVEEVRLEPLRRLRTLEGGFDEILARAASDPRPDDYIFVRHHADGPLLNPLGRLREVYKNVLSVAPLERELTTRGENVAAARAALRQRVSNDELFTRFFRDVTGEELERAHVDRVAHELREEE